jgi:hypothetical protein
VQWVFENKIFFSKKYSITYLNAWAFKYSQLWSLHLKKKSLRKQIENSSTKFNLSVEFVKKNRIPNWKLNNFFLKISFYWIFNDYLNWIFNNGLVLFTDWLNFFKTGKIEYYWFVWFFLNWIFLNSSWTLCIHSWARQFESNHFFIKIKFSTNIWYFFYRKTKN